MGQLFPEGYVIAPRFYPVLEKTVNDQIITLDRLALRKLQMRGDKSISRHKF